MIDAPQRDDIIQMFRKKPMKGFEMAYDVNNENYRDLTEAERELVGLDYGERKAKVVQCLEDMEDADVYGMCEQFNSYDGSFPCCEYFYYGDFIEFIKPYDKTELDDFFNRKFMSFMKGARAYEGDDLEYAAYGFAGNGRIVVKDWDEVRHDSKYHIDELADKIMTDGIDRIDVPDVIADMFLIWDMEDEEEFEGESEF